MPNIVLLTIAADSPLLVEMKQVSGQIIVFLQVLDCLASANISFGYPMTNFLETLASPIDLD